MKKKVHKAAFYFFGNGEATYRGRLCVRKPDNHEIYTSTRWERVTCKRCLAKEKP